MWMPVEAMSYLWRESLQGGTGHHLSTGDSQKQSFRGGPTPEYIHSNAINNLSLNTNETGNSNLSVENAANLNINENVNTNITTNRSERKKGRRRKKGKKAFKMYDN